MGARHAAAELEPAAHEVPAGQLEQPVFPDPIYRKKMCKKSSNVNITWARQQLSYKEQKIILQQHDASKLTYAAF